MGKKVREYKSGDFIFAKVKGYPAWPARVQRLNGKKYFVYFYGTGETANLPPNMIFDYAENKDKFLTKTQKRRDFNDGVRQIEHDFANNVPLEDVIGVPMEVGTEAPANDTVNDSAANDTMDETADTTANDTVDEDANTTQNDATIEDSDENGALVIDEGKASKKKTKPDAAKTPAKETPKAKEPKTPRGKAKKDEPKKDDDKLEDNEKQEEIVSRSGRKIRPKRQPGSRFVDEQIEENSTLPSPAPKRKRGPSPLVEKDKPEPKDKNIRSFNAVRQSELEDLKQPFKPEDPDKENILIAYLPSGKYVGIKLFQSRPVRFKNESTRLQWDRQAASNAITLKMQLERDQITALSVQGQLVMDLNLTDEDKTTLDKERETDEKKSRVQFLKTEMKLIELDAKIKTCLSLEKADAELCIQLLDELMNLDVKPLMLLKHPTCLDTIKRMRSYIGNTPSWDLTENAALLFSKQAYRIRKLADAFYKNVQELFTTPDGLEFWEFFLERVEQFKTVSSKLSASELLEMVHEPLEMSQPTSHTMTAAIDAANRDSRDSEPTKRKPTPAKPKKTANNNTPIATKGKRQSSRKQPDAENEDKDEETTEEANKDTGDNAKEPETPLPEPAEDVEMADVTKETEEQTVNDKESEVPPESGKNDKSKDSKKNKPKEGKKSLRNIEKNAKDAEKAAKDSEKNTKDTEESAKQTEKGNINTDQINNDTEKTAKDDEIAAKDSKTDNVETDDSINEENKSKDKENESNSKDEVPKLNDEVPKVAENTEPEDKKSPKKASLKEEKTLKTPDKSSDDPEKILDETKTDQEPQTSDEKVEVKEKSSNKRDDKKKADRNAKESKESKESEKGKESEKRKADDDKAKEDVSEPRAKRSRDTRESKKTEAPPVRSPAKRKSKY